MVNNWLFVANDKVQAFKRKLEFYKTCICHHGLDRLQILKDFSDGVGDEFNACDSLLLILYNEMCQDLKDLDYSVNQYFSDMKCMILQNLHNYKRSIQNAR